MGRVDVATYSLRLDDGEVARYRAMAARAHEQESKLWRAAGITANADVMDMGCGPGACLPLLAESTSPRGHVIGVDGSEQAVVAARSLVQRLELTGRVDIVHAPCTATGLDEASFDVIFMRNVLIHNAHPEEILAHAHWLLRARAATCFRLRSTPPKLSFPPTPPTSRSLRRAGLTGRIQWATTRL